MNFLDRFETQLAYASAELRREQQAAGPPPHKRRRWRLAVLPVVAVAVTAPALAIVQPWSPQVGSGDDRVSTSDVPVADSLLDAFGVLRRPQTSKDRRVAAPVLRRLGRPISKVQVAGVRAIRPDVAVVPIRGMSDRDPGRPDPGAQVCLVSGAVLGCTPLATAARRGVTFTTASPGRTRYQGLVPDGVKSVRFTAASTGEQTTVDVVANYFTITLFDTEPSQSIPRPDPGRTVPRPGQTARGPSADGARIPGPAMPLAGRLAFLGASGDVLHEDP